MTEKRLIASDYDGTLRRAGGVSSYTKNKILEWQKAGNYFGIVTGRGSDFFETVKEIGGLKPDFYILYNGSLVTDGDGGVIYEGFLDRDIFSKIEKFMDEHTEGFVYDRAGEAEKYRQFYGRHKNCAPVLEAAKRLNELYPDRINAMVNGNNLNIAVKGDSKANGVRKILDYYGLSEAQAAVVGDDYNDLDMIVSLGGWAISTGKKAVKKQALHTCYSVGALVRELMK